MREKKIKFVLPLIVLFALGIRLFRLGEIPPSLHWDESSWGYNAYSILKTGRDEYGHFVPLIFKAFGDYKSSIYVYLTTVSVAIFGLNELAVRLPAALFGGISIFFVFLAVKEIFKEFKGSQPVALLTAAILALSPWHYHYSHGAWEVNILLVFLLLGILFFLRAERKKPWLLYLSAFSFGLCFYVYNSAKLLTPSIILGLFFLFRARFFRFSPKVLLISLAILGLMILPVFKFTFLDGAGGRLKVMSIFSYPRSIEEAGRIAEEGGVAPESLVFKVFHGSPSYFVRGVLGRYLNHFSGRFLFFEGDWSNPRHSVPHVGVLNQLDLFFLVLGAYFLISKGIKNQAFIWYFLAVAPLPAALSRDVVQATRSYFMVLPFSIISAFGMYYFFSLLTKLKKSSRLVVLGVAGFAYFFSFVYFLDQYFVHAPIQNSSFWQYGYKQVVEFIKDKTDDYDQVVFTQKYGQPYIYYLFYTQYDPWKYQAQAKLVESPEGDVGWVAKVDNIEFRDIYWPEDRFKKNTLFIGGPYELPTKDILPGESKLLKEIKFLNGETAFVIVETEK